MLGYPLPPPFFILHPAENVEAMTGAVAAILGPRGYLEKANYVLKMAGQKEKGASGVTEPHS